MTDHAWHLGLVNADGSGFKVVKNAELKPDAFSAPEWARDGKSIFCHDLDNIYQIDLDGNVLKKWELSKILTDASMNGGDRLSISPDGNALLMAVDCGSEHERKNWDGPQPAIEKLDLTADKAVRITGKDHYVWEPFWLSAGLVRACHAYLVAIPCGRAGPVGKAVLKSRLNRVSSTSLFRFTLMTWTLWSPS